MKSVFFTNSPEETKGLGKVIGKTLRAGDAIGLTGKLGTGKTCFVQGIAEGLEISPENYVRSPSFVIMNIYSGRIPLYHIDLYRLQSGEEIQDIGLEDYIFGDGVSVTEWADKAPDLLDDTSLMVMFYYADERRRKIEVSGDEARWEYVFKELPCPC
jgi:tRNA threonylcarbamoyladenosine biosynthesis protein TsaE